MTHEEQDKLWAQLSEETRKEIQYNWLNIQEAKAINDLSAYGVGRHDVYKELFGKHNLQPSLTYDDVVKELFSEGKAYCAQNGEMIRCTTCKQAEKIEAINKLLNVAKFLNKNEDGSNWEPNWMNNSEKKWYIFIDRDGDVHVDEELDGSNSCIAYFRTEAIAKQVIQILGEDVVRTALTTKY